MLATSAIAAVWQPMTMTCFRWSPFGSQFGHIARSLSGQVTYGCGETVLL